MEAITQLSDSSLLNHIHDYYECRVQHDIDVKNKIIHSDLDYTIFEKIKALNICQNTDHSKPCETIVTIDGQQYLYIRFYSGTHTLDHTYTPADGLSGMIVEGISPSETTLDARNDYFSGIGFNLYSPNTSGSNKFLYIQNLSILGGYTGFEDKNRKIPKSNTKAAMDKWQKAIYTYGLNAHTFVRNLNITGFYYGLVAEDGGDAVAEQLNITDSGDGGFFSYFGGRLYVCHSESSYAADSSRGIGFGFVAESLEYRRTDNKGIAQCKGGNPDNPDRWDNLDFIRCIINASLKFSENERSTIFARNTSSHDNLFGGFLANMGAKIDLENCVIYNQYSDRAAQIEKLDIRDLNAPNIYMPGEFGAGHGIIARLGSTAFAKHNKVFNNLIGFNAYWDGVIDATGSDAWNNSYFAFHSILNSFINASETRSFGFSQLFSYAVDNSSGLQVDHSLAFDANILEKYTGEKRFCEQFETPCIHEQIISAEKYIGTRGINKISSIEPKLGIFEIVSQE